MSDNTILLYLLMIVVGLSGWTAMGFYYLFQLAKKHFFSEEKE